MLLLLLPPPIEDDDGGGSGGGGGGGGGDGPSNPFATQIGTYALVLAIHAIHAYGNPATMSQLALGGELVEALVLAGAPVWRGVPNYNPFYAALKMSPDVNAISGEQEAIINLFLAQPGAQEDFCASPELKLELGKLQGPWRKAIPAWAKDT